MRSVVEAYERDGFIAAQDIKLIHSYVDGGFLYRQVILIRALVIYCFLIATKKVELVHCHVAMRGSFWRKSIFAILARVFRIPVIFHLHGSEMRVFYAQQPRFIQRAIGNQLARATRVVVLSESWREFVCEIAPSANIAVVPNYVRLPRVGTGPRQSTLLFLGLIGERKGAFDLLRAYVKIRSAHPEIMLVMAGNGQVDDAKALAFQLGIQDSVVFPGWVDGEQKSALLASASTFILPSHNEGLPVSILEAMSYRLVVVSTTVGGIPELVRDGVDGVLVEAGNIDQIARAVIDIADDPALQARLAASAYSRVDGGYTDGVVLPLLAEVYRQVAGGA